jgi:hypothetical protein
MFSDQDLALEDGEIDLDLIEPAGVDRSVDQHDGRPCVALAAASAGCGGGSNGVTAVAISAEGAPANVQTYSSR